MLPVDQVTWPIDRKIARQVTPREHLSTPAPLWDSKPIGKSIFLRLCPREHLSPQLILEDKVFRSAIRLQHGSTYRSQLQFVGTLIIDDETQRLTYVIDRIQVNDSPRNEANHHHMLLSNKQLNGEFLIPIRCDNKNSTTMAHADSSLIQEGMKTIDAYCHSSLPIELHHFSFLHGQMLSRLSPSINADLSFDLLTIKNSFKLTPISSEYVQILPTALLKNINASTGNGIYFNQPHFGYWGLDRMSANKILLILENDPQACALPIVGIWVSGIVDVQCAYVWAACLRYCLNSSLKQRLRTGVNATNTTQQSFLLACYPSTSRGQCDFYEVSSTTMNSTSPSSFILDYDLWTCTKKIIMPNPSTSHSHDTSGTTQLPYDFEFKHVHDGPKMHALLGAVSGHPSLPIHHHPTRPIASTQMPTDISFLSAEILSDDDDDDEHVHSNHAQRLQQEHHQTTLSSPNTNGSLFGVPRLPPRQSVQQSPSWDSISTPTITTPKWIAPVPAAVPTSTAPPPPPLRFSSPAPSTIAPSTVAADAQWKEEMLEKMQAYDAHIQSLNALVAQLLAVQQQHQQCSISTPTRESTKCDVAVQSEPPSPCTSDDVGESASMVKSNRNSPPSPPPKIDPLQHYQQQTPIMTTATRLPLSLTQFQSPPPPAPVASMARQPEPVINYASLRKSADCERPIVDNTPVRATSPPPDLNPVDILKPFFQFMASQQQKQHYHQQQQQQQQLQYQQQEEYHRPASPTSTATATSKSFDTALIQTIDEESGRQAEKMSNLATVIQQQQQQHVTSTTTTGISFISNGLQMQIINQQSSTTTVYPPVQPSAPPPAMSVNDLISSSHPSSETDLSIEVRSLQMKYLDDDQLAIATEYDHRSPTPSSIISQSPQTFDKNMSFATQKYFQKYNILTGLNHQQQCYLASDENDLFISSSPPRQRMLLPLPQPASQPIFTQAPLPHAPQAKILDLSQIRKLPKLL